MKARVNWPMLALASFLVLSTAAAFVPQAHSQDETSDTAKRKLKVKVDPEYPPIARQLSLQGKVRVETTVAPDGHVTNTKVLGGNPVLASAATDAIKRWRYEPGPKETIQIVEVDFNRNN